jgi:uncharacterized membrane protein
MLPVLASPAESSNVIELWEIHPMLVHFPIAYLLGAVVLDVVARTRGWELDREVTGLFVAGAAIGWLAASAGLLAFFIVPAHTAEAHRLMYWHAAIQVTSLGVFSWIAWARWRGRGDRSRLPSVWLGCLVALTLMIGSGIGGYMVYHGGAGIEPSLLDQRLLGHSH